MKTTKALFPDHLYIIAMILVYLLAILILIVWESKFLFALICGVIVLRVARFYQLKDDPIEKKFSPYKLSKEGYPIITIRNDPKKINPNHTPFFRDKISKIRN